jgi:hypothetical protein
MCLYRFMFVYNVGIMSWIFLIHPVIVYSFST